MLRNYLNTRLGSQHTQTHTCTHKHTYAQTHGMHTHAYTRTPANVNTCKLTHPHELTEPQDVHHALKRFEDSVVAGRQEYKHLALQLVEDQPVPGQCDDKPVSANVKDKREERGHATLVINTL